MLRTHPQVAREELAPRRNPEGVGDQGEAEVRLSPVTAVDAADSNARLDSVEVVLRKLGKGSRAVAGRLVRAPRKGSVVVIEFSDGMHEDVTTPVKRVLH